MHACGADLNQAHTNGATPAFIAAEMGHVAIIEFLVQQGCPLLSYQTTAEQLQLYLHDKDSVVVDRMKAFIARANLANPALSIYIHPEDIAEIMGHQTIVTLLKEYRLINSVGVNTTVEALEQDDTPSSRDNPSQPSLVDSGGGFPRFFLQPESPTVETPLHRPAHES